MRKRLVVLVVFLLAMVPVSGLWSPTAHAEYDFIGGGDGSPEEPYIILTAEDLDRVRDKPTASYKLGADIDLSPIASWVPIGDSGYFTGTFDGDNYTIRGMTINSSAGFLGLFGIVNSAIPVFPTPVSIKNVRLENVNITATDPHAQVGGLAGAIADHARIEGVFVSGTIRASGFSAGGIAGNVRNGVSYSEAHVEISGSPRYAGGLIGISGGNAAIEQSYATGDVHTSGEAAGGLIGEATFYQVINSYANGSVTLDLGDSWSNPGAGGLIGKGSQAVTITNSYASGNVAAGIGSAGGLVGTWYDDGDIESMEVIQSYWNGTDSTMTTIGGVGGRSEAVDAADMRSWNTFDDWDTTIWGIRESASLPYLLRFAPEVKVEELSPSYNTSAPGHELAVNVMIRDGSVGERLTIRMKINNSLDEALADNEENLYANGMGQSIEEWSIAFDELQYPAGTYHLIVTAEDTVGTNVWERTFFFDINDTTAPSEPVLTSPANGASLSDPTPTIGGTAEAGSTVTIILDGSDIATVTAGMGGDWEWTPATALGEGDHMVSARAADAAGNVGSESEEHAFTVDVTSPVITLQGSATMSILVGDAFVDPGATVEDEIDDDVSVTVAGHVDHLTPGTYELTYSAQDNAGNLASEVSRTVRVHARSIPVYHSDNADLKQLTVTAAGVEQKLAPLFAAETVTYKLETAAERIDIRVVRSHGGSTVTLNDEQLPLSGIWTPALAEGENMFDIKVTAENGKSKTYRLTIVRLAEEEQPPVSPDPAACDFRDIGGHWAEVPICEAAAQGLVEGEDEGMFHPQRQVTRIEFAAMLLRALGLSSDGGSEELTFADADLIPAWAKKAASVAVNEGVLEGYPDGTLRPLQTVSRAEMAAMLARAFEQGFDGEAIAPFADDAVIPEWARAYIYNAAMHGLLYGRGDNQFVPSGLATRAEAAATVLRLWRMLQ